MKATTCNRITLGIIVGLTFCVSGGAFAQFTTPLHVGNIVPICDQKGSYLYGNPWTQPGDRVELIKAYTGVLYPPDANGSPHPYNEIIYVSSIGNLAPWVPESGIFGMSISGPERPTDGRLYVRVFNAPTTAQAGFYGNSQAFDINGNDEFIVNISCTSMAFRTGDPDGDGLIDAWELELGSCTNCPDSDGDGMNDGAEYRAHTNPNDPNSNLAVARLLPGGGANLIVSWSSVSGMVYQVEYSAEKRPDKHSSYVNAGTAVTATGTESQLLVANGLNDPERTYRVRLVEN